MQPKATDNCCFRLFYYINSVFSTVLLFVFNLCRGDSRIARIRKLKTKKEFKNSKFTLNCIDRQKFLNSANTLRTIRELSLQHTKYLKPKPTDNCCFRYFLLHKTVFFQIFCCLFLIFVGAIHESPV